MLIGAHVSPAGGPAKAIERGTERGCRAIQIFNQSPRQWRPTVYSEEQVAAYHEARRGSKVDALLIHAVYLLNAASTDKEIRDKTRTSLIASLQAGDALEAKAVVLHAGSAKTGQVAPAIKRAGKVIREALSESENCPLHLENTAGTGGTLGRSFEELARLLEAAGGDARLGVCLDSCHLLASGYEIRTPDEMTAVARRLRGGGRPRARRLAAPQRQRQPAGLQPRPARERLRGRARSRGLRRVPVRAALRRAAVRARDPRREPQRPDGRGDRVRAHAAQRGKAKRRRARNRGRAAA